MTHFSLTQIMSAGNATLPKSAWLQELFLRSFTTLGGQDVTSDRSAVAPATRHRGLLEAAALLLVHTAGKDTARANATGLILLLPLSRLTAIEKGRDPAPLELRSRLLHLRARPAVKLRFGAQGWIAKIGYAADLSQDREGSEQKVSIELETIVPTDE